MSIGTRWSWIAARVLSRCVTRYHAAAATATRSTSAARGKRPPRADHHTVLSRKLRSGYALPAFPAPAAPSRIPTPSDHLTPTAAVAVFCSALWSGFSLPLTLIWKCHMYRATCSPIEAILMNFPTEKAQAAGTIVAVVVAMIALLYTVSSDRKAQFCSSLYEKNDKLIAMYAEVHTVLQSLSKMEEKTQKFTKEMDAQMERDGEISSELEQDIDKHLRLALETQRQAAITLRSLFRRYRYAYSKEKFSEIDSRLNEGFGETNLDSDEARTDAIESHYMRYQESILFGLKTIDTKTEEIADELRSSCEN